MIFEEYILRTHVLCILIWLITVIPLVLYILVLRRKIKIYIKKRSLISTREEIKKIFSMEEEKAIRIRKSGKDSAKRFDLVTVLFSDIQGFTKIAEQLNPESLIDELDIYFYHFDSVVEKYNIEKIKTIGDAYMCAGGIPDENRTNPIEVILAALEIQQFMHEMKHKKGEMWDLRIGIHTGSVIAGVVGHKKISYDIWGDTVNTASRMESSCTPGRINISGHTYEFVKDYFICEYRGKMPVKYKGNIDMYYVTAIKPALKTNVDNFNLTKLTAKLQLLRIYDIEKYVLRQFEKYNNPELTYHNIKNTIDLYTHAELFAHAEDLSDIDSVAVVTTALFKNIGYLISYENHLEETLRLIKEILSKFHYLPEQIKEICDLVIHLEKNETPNSLKQKVLHDAVYSYLGRIDFEDIMNEMYKEAKTFLKEKSDSWKRKQIEMLKDFVYHTRAATALREVSSTIQIEKLEKLKL